MSVLIDLLSIIFTAIFHLHPPLLHREFHKALPRDKNKPSITPTKSLKKPTSAYAILRSHLSRLSRSSVMRAPRDFKNFLSPVAVTTAATARKSKSSFSSLALRRLKSSLEKSLMYARARLPSTTRIHTQTTAERVRFSLSFSRAWKSLLLSVCLSPSRARLPRHTEIS